MFGPMRLVWCVLAMSLAACPRKAGPGVTTVQPAGAGCPAASDVYMASYLTPEEGAQGGHTGWVLPLHHRVVESLEGVPDYATIDAAAASAAGVPAPPANLWLLLPNGQRCNAKLGSYYAAAIQSSTPNIAYGVELAGCAAPPDPNDAAAIALVSAAEPSGCQVLPPMPVAARLGETDQQGTWQRPTKETPIPPELAAIVPQRECTPPTCEKLWSIAKVEFAGKPVAWAGAVNWVEIPAGATPDTQCNWKVDTFSGSFVAAADGSLTKVTEGQEQPLVLLGALADAQGAKALIATGPGQYTTYGLANGAATVARRLVWLVAHAEDFLPIDQLGPYCGL